MGGLFHIYYLSGNGTKLFSKELSNKYRSAIRSEVTIGGKRASMLTDIPAADEVMCIHDSPTVQVYFPDIGRGRKLYMRFSSGDEQGIEVAKQVIDSLEFPGAEAGQSKSRALP
jgi:hypothetical protein